MDSDIEMDGRIGGTKKKREPRTQIFKDKGETMKIVEKHRGIGSNYKLMTTIMYGLETK